MQREEDGDSLCRRNFIFRVSQKSYQEFIFPCDSAGYYLGHALDGGASLRPLQAVQPHKMEAKAPGSWSSLARLSTL